MRVHLRRIYEGLKWFHLSSSKFIPFGRICQELSQESLQTPIECNYVDFSDDFKFFTREGFYDGFKHPLLICILLCCEIVITKKDNEIEEKRIVGSNLNK